MLKGVQAPLFNKQKTSVANTGSQKCVQSGHSPTESACEYGFLHGETLSEHCARLDNELTAGRANVGARGEPAESPLIETTVQPAPKLSGDFCPICRGRCVLKDRRRRWFPMDVLEAHGLEARG